MIKIDVEGCERLVLKRLHLTMEKYHPTMVVEVTPFMESGFQDRASFEREFPAGYTFYSLKKTGYDNARYELEDLDFEFERGVQYNIVAVPAGEKIQLTGPGESAASK
jgi:hypothetical protein